MLASYRGGPQGGVFPKRGGVVHNVIDKLPEKGRVRSMFSATIVLHVVVSAMISCLVTFSLLRTRGVRGVRELHRDLLDLSADHAATVKRQKKIQNSLAGEASVEAKKVISKTTLDFVEAQRNLQSSDGHAAGQ